MLGSTRMVNVVNEKTIDLKKMRHYSINPTTGLSEPHTYPFNPFSCYLSHFRIYPNTIPFFPAQYDFLIAWRHLHTFSRINGTLSHCWPRDKNQYENKRGYYDRYWIRGAESQGKLGLTFPFIQHGDLLKFKLVLIEIDNGETGEENH